MAEGSMENSLQRELPHRAHRVLKSELVRRMGYRRVNEKLLARIDRALGDEWPGLYRADFDYRYSSDAFLHALCDALDIDPALRDAEHERLRAIVRTRRMGLQPYVFVDTHFKRTSEPIFALAVMQPRRLIHFEPSFCDLGVARQVTGAQEPIREHYAATGGELPMGGTIQRYLFFYGDRQALILDTGGSIIGESDGLHTNTARVSIDGKALNEVISMAEPEHGEP